MKSNKPLVSIIIPVYNTAEYLGQCLESILAQTVENIEVICVNDGSTDESEKVLKSYKKDKRLKIFNQKNLGLSLARNHGLSKATGEFVLFLDSDDFVETNMLEKMLTTAQKDHSDMVICSHTLFIDSVNRGYWGQEFELRFMKQSSFLLIPKEHPDDLFFCYAYVWEKLIRRSFLEKYNLKFLSRKFLEDIPFTYTAMTLANKISLMPDQFVHYRQKRKNQLILKRDEKIEEFYSAWTDLWTQLKKYQVNTFFKKSYTRTFLRNFLTKTQNIEIIQKNLTRDYIAKLPPEIVQLFEKPSTGPKVSIVIPIYNAAHFLPKCIDSCLNQTLKDIEIICINNGSTDESLKIINSYAAKDNRIKVLTQKRQEIAATRNRAMRYAKGEFIQFLNAEDYLESDTCKFLYIYNTLLNLNICQFMSFHFSNKNKKEIISSPILNSQNLSSVFGLTIYRRHFLIQNDIHWKEVELTEMNRIFLINSVQKTNQIGLLNIPLYHRRFFV